MLRGNCPWLWFVLVGSGELCLAIEQLHRSNIFTCFLFSFPEPPVVALMAYLLLLFVGVCRGKDSNKALSLIKTSVMFLLPNQ